MAKPKVLYGDHEMPTANTPPWHRTHGTYLAGEAEVTETDILANRLEQRWGVGRLRLLAPVELREKFDRQRYLFNHAIWHGDLEEVRTQARRMRAAWSALDRHATSSGADPIAANVWEVVLEDGSIAAIVRSNAEAHHVISGRRGVAVYTLEEIGRLLSGFPALATAKDVFPGASVERVRQIRDPLDSIHDSSPALDDKVPF